MSNLSAGLTQAVWRQAGATTYQLHDSTTPRLNASKIPNSSDEKCFMAWRQQLTGLEFGTFSERMDDLAPLNLQLGISLCGRSFPMAVGRRKAIPSCSAVDMSGWPPCGRSMGSRCNPPFPNSPPRHVRPTRFHPPITAAARARSNGPRSTFKIVHSSEGCGQQSTWSLPSGYQVHGQLQLGLC
jgi:hypothetical protein